MPDHTTHTEAEMARFASRSWSDDRGVKVMNVSQAQAVADQIVAARLADVRALADRYHRRATLYAASPNDDVASGMATAYIVAERDLRVALAGQAPAQAEEGPASP